MCLLHDAWLDYYHSTVATLMTEAEHGFIGTRAGAAERGETLQLLPYNSIPLEAQSSNHAGTQKNQNFIQAPIGSFAGFALLLLLLLPTSWPFTAAGREQKLHRYGNDDPLEKQLFSLNSNK